QRAHQRVRHVRNRFPRLASDQDLRCLLRRCRARHEADRLPRPVARGNTIGLSVPTGNSRRALSTTVGRFATVICRMSAESATLGWGTNVANHRAEMNCLAHRRSRPALLTLLVAAGSGCATINSGPYGVPLDGQNRALPGKAAGPLKVSAGESASLA